MSRKSQLVLCALLAFAAAPVTGETGPWRFGVIGDTQWWNWFNNEVSDPNSVAVEVIKQVNPHFIGAGVKFVIQVGDLTENSSLEGMASRMEAAKPLFDAGIGFYPLRGNHEFLPQHAVQFQIVFTQTQGQGPNVFGATNFSSPFETLAGLSYSFDYGGARFVLLDQYYRTDGSLGPDLWAESGLYDQLPWIHERLTSDRGRGDHAFVFGHQNLIGQNHSDVLFGASPASDPATQNSFISNLQTNGVRYYVSGHDHMHHRSLVGSPDGLYRLEQVISCSASTKLYVPLGSPLIPGSMSNDNYYDDPPREKPIAQECYKVGYYIYTVDGPRVTVDYYSAEVPLEDRGGIFLVPNIPPLNFKLRERFGYSLNGSEYTVSQGQAYTNIQHSIPAGAGFRGTAMRVLSGINASTNADAAGRPLVKTVDTGWSAATTEISSDISSIWGMADLGSENGDTFVLSLSYADPRITDLYLRSGRFCLASRDANGRWQNTVNANLNGEKRFVLGPWESTYSLGTYGVDSQAQTVWAVLDHPGDFAAVYVPPLLATAQSGGSISLEWPADAVQYELQECGDLSVGNWVPVTPAPAGNSLKLAPSSERQRYFRLYLKH